MARHRTGLTPAVRSTPARARPVELVEPGHVHGSGSAMSPRVAVATSEHPIATHAVAECAGSLLEASPGGFGELLCFVGPPFGGALIDIAGALATLLDAADVAGLESQGVLMGGRIARGTPALAVLAFGAGEASLGYLGDLGPGITGVSRSADASGVTAGSPPLRRLRILFTDPLSGTCAPPSPVGCLPGAVSLVGCQMSGGGNGAPARVFHDGIEHRGGALFVDVDAEAASVHLVHGTEAVPGAMSAPVTVSSVIDGQVVALDDVPAAELLEARLHSMDADRLNGVKQVGFCVPGDGRLVAARRSALGLATSMPLVPGTRVIPAVCSDHALAEQLDAVLDGPSGGTALLIPTEDIGSGVPSAEYPEEAQREAAHVVGPLASGVLWGDPAHYEAVGHAVLVVRIAPDHPRSTPAGPGPVGL